VAAAPEVLIHRSPFKGLRLFNADRFRWVDEAAALGPLSALRVGPFRLAIVTDVELGRTILLTENERWVRPPATVVPIRLAIGENLFTEPNETWAVHQAAVAPNFRRKALDARLAVMDEIIEAEVASFPLDTSIDFEVATGRLALMLAAWVMFGERLDRVRADEITRHQREAVRWVGNKLGTVAAAVPIAVGKRARAMREHAAVLAAYADEVIARAQANAHTEDDVLGALVRAKLAPDELRGQVLGLFLAGNETTAAALGLAMVQGAAHPGEWVKVRDDPERWAAPFIDETLRLCPAVWGIPRVPAVKGMELRLGDVTMRMNRSQVANIYLRGINRDPAIWSEPERFDPARHLTDDKDRQRALIPFGLGPRGCIGQHLALAEMRAVLPVLARRGDVAIDGPVEEDPNFALRIRGGLRGRLTAPRVPA
jgi:cytochrome P450